MKAYNCTLEYSTYSILSAEQYQKVPQEGSRGSIRQLDILQTGLCHLQSKGDDIHLVQVWPWRR